MSEYWRSVLQACGGQAALAEGIGGAPLGRRELIQLFGASLALAGLGGCNQRPRERILPYVTTPRELTPGLAVDYATAMELDGFAVGLLVKSHEGRPTKIEGNPLHPASLGASGVYQQASVLSLYDPSRLRGPLQDQQPVTWNRALAALQGPPSWRPWFVLPPQSSPVTLAWLGRVRERNPGARFCFHTPLPRQGYYQATNAVFGEPLEAQPDFSASRVVLALDSDFLNQGPMSLRWSRDFSARHAPRAGSADMSRLYAVESALTPTGSVSDHRLALRSADVPRFAATLLGELARNDERARLPGLDALGALPSVDGSEHAPWIRALAADLLNHQGACVVLAGCQQSFDTQVLALALNAALGSFGRTLRLTTPALASPLGEESLPLLRAAIDRGQVDALIVLDTDPLYGADPGLELEAAFARVPMSVQLTQHLNATSRACRWLLPLSHYLESWGDSRAFDGTLSYVQPLIEPLRPSRSLLEVVAACAGEPWPNGHDLLRAHWRAQVGVRSEADFNVEWSERLQRGLVAGSAFPELRRTPHWERAFTLARTALRIAPREGYELSVPASPGVYDGRFAHNAWLLELPDPITKQMWGNALRMSAEDARELGVNTGSVVELERSGQTIRAPVVVSVGQAPGTLALALGFGQSHVRAAESRATSAHPESGGSGSRARHQPGQLSARPAIHPRSPRPPALAVAGAAAPEDRTPGRPAMGHDHRHHALHWLQRLRGRVQRGEQRACGRAHRGHAGPRDALAPDRHLRG
jgi:hypothetical protein